MNKTWLLLSMFSISACSQAHKTDSPPIDNIAQAMSATERSEADITRDGRSRPDVTLAMLDIGPGDVVFDVFGGGGYYSDLIARIVGEDGKVYLHNNAAYRGFVKDALTNRMENNSLPQLIRHDREATDLGMAVDSLDAAMIIMSYHDLYYVDADNGWPKIDHQNFMNQIHTGLKKGGRFMIVDHNAKVGSQANDSQLLHRIAKAYAIEQIEAIGFKLVAESAVLANSNDDKSTSVFTPDNRGKTDRFILVFEKI